MRWFLLLLIVLNVFYYVWHQQQMPLAMSPSVESNLTSGQKIRLLGESGSLPDRKTAIAEGEMCLYLGGLDTEPLLKSIEQRLLSLDIATEFVISEKPDAVEYWVYLPPLVSRQAALRQLRELQARQIDSYIISQGDLANGISLGIFSKYDSAVSVSGRLRGAGYDVQLKELSRMHKQYWIKILPDSQRLVDNELLARLTGEFGEIQQRFISCESVVPD